MRPWVDHRFNGALNKARIILWLTMKAPIKVMVTSVGFSLDLAKHVHFAILRPLWLHEAFGDMRTSIVSNSHFGKRPGT